MIHKVIKRGLLGVGILLTILLVMVVVLLVDWGRSSAARERDKVIQGRTSPDGTLVAEIHRATTAMWGGPDTVYVTIRRISAAWGEKVYSKSYECDDLSAFGLQWNRPRQLSISYGDCHESKFNSPTEFAHENRVLQREANWGDVTIEYVDTHHIATH